jgi:protein-disulfide isomerase
VFRDVLNHGERSIRASEAAHCAGLQGQFWQMHETLFQRQEELTRNPSAEMVPLLQRLGATLNGLDQAQFSTCLTERQTAGGIRAADAEQRRRGIASQPIFEIGTQRLSGFQTLDQISAAIETFR